MVLLIVQIIVPTSYLDFLFITEQPALLIYSEIIHVYIQHNVALMKNCGREFHSWIVQEKKNFYGISCLR